MRISKFEAVTKEEKDLLIKLAKALDFEDYTEKKLFLFDELGNWEFRLINPAYEWYIFDINREQIHKILAQLTLQDKSFEEIVNDF